jgi:hypothetical protein
MVVVRLKAIHCRDFEKKKDTIRFFGTCLKCAMRFVISTHVYFLNEVKNFPVLFVLFVSAASVWQGMKQLLMLVAFWILFAFL